MAMQTRIVKPNELRMGDVVRYKHTTFPFEDMQVVRFADNGVYLWRPYLDYDGTPGCEEGFWLLDSNFAFELVGRGS